MATRSFRIVGSELKGATEDALTELQEIMRAACAAGTVPRHLASRYTACRAALLGSELRGALPGFLTQCVSLQKFFEFIQLFSPVAAHRIAFMHNSFEACRPRPAPPPLPPRPVPGGRTFDVFGEK
jgi:hypothetical protein